MPRCTVSKQETSALPARVLLVDDQPTNLEVLCQVLEGHGYKVMLAPSAEVALRSVNRAVPDLILLDVMMPEMDGYEVCRRLKQEERTRAIPVIFITARDQQEEVVTGFEAGGVDYIVKPFREAEVLARVQAHVRLSRLARELAQKNQQLEEEIAGRQALKGQLSLLAEREAAQWGLEGFVGHSPAIQEILAQVHLLQESATTSVLITGESGTGKELIARAIHFGSVRRSRPFVPVNCAAIPAELVESLLFGHVRGTFTGADADRSGYFEMAHEGTLFLDEIGEMPLAAQATLLRVLEDGEVWRIGARESSGVDVRVLAATNGDLIKKIEAGQFRQDLYFRLARYVVVVPPLREHREDVPLLARHFLRLFSKEMGRPAPALGPGVETALKTYAFPGNVRELKNLIERALIESRGEEIQVRHLHFAVAEGSNLIPPALFDSALDLDQAAAQAELWVVKRAVAQAGGNISEAARLLNTNRNRIYRILDQEPPPPQP
ncbi:MAG: sigma-54-dependent Fis family transcriptional regulator [Candidatus Latescibacteria bacterium]|nr:sigma-54-dependent Fis family transcriptional regulator [Candidatus Latescibacterota bacterium]